MKYVSPRWLSTALLALLSALTFTVSAQTAERRTSFGLNMSAIQYQGDLGTNFWNFKSNRYAPGISINQYLCKGLDLNTQAYYTEINGFRSFDTRFATAVFAANAGLKFRLNNGWLLKERFPVQPYLLAASGWVYANRSGMYEGQRIVDDKGYVDLFGAAGINFRLGDIVGIYVQTGLHRPPHANLDGIPTAGSPRWADQFLQHTVGITFNLGQPPDTDEDGIPDPLDRCPNTPYNIVVDINGCPLDKDKDGVPDYMDQCPTEFGKPELKGCPDRDNDGLDDDEDACPDIPGKPELHGCPDSDNDGVADQNDECPNTPPGEAVNETGCAVSQLTPPADTTKVAVVVPQPTANDADGDGVPDAEDRCPNRPGPASNRGCPEVQAATRQSLLDATQLIGFEKNQATLLTSSYPTLDTLARILSQYPDYSLSISGHSDSQGPEAFNLRLSRERAAAARTYLLSKGVAAKRIELRGYGPKHPIADNATPEGRARNRRVEFDLFLTGDPNPAQAKYGAEPKQAAPAKKATPAKKPAPRKKAPAKSATPPKKAAPAQPVRPVRPAPPVRRGPEW